MTGTPSTPTRQRSTRKSTTRWTTRATAPAVPADGGWRVPPLPVSAAIPVALVMLALPFVRPNTFGEFGLSIIGFGMLSVAAVLSVLMRSTEEQPDAEQPRRSTGQPGVPVVVCLGVGYVWLMAKAAATDPGVLGGPAIQGMFLTVGSVLALLVVCREPRTRLAVGRGFVLVLAALCASYVVTVLLWAVTGIGSGELVSIPIGTVTEPQPIFFPLTPSQGIQSVFGVDIPRLTGLGREPGWMAMYCGIAYFMADMVKLRLRWLKLLLVVGLIGCISTAGFGVFVVAWAYHTFLRDRGAGIDAVGFLRQLFGLVAVAGAVWVATAAPVLGLSAKSTQNETSLDERQLATEAGIRAITDRPLGGRPTEVQGGINLISDIAVSGLPFVLLIVAALVLPMLVRGTRGRYSNAGIIIVFLTLLLAQPARDSTWAFAVVALIAGLRHPDMEPLVPVSRHRLTDERRTP